jgi:hypothetical protein
VIILCGAKPALFAAKTTNAVSCLRSPEMMADAHKAGPEMMADFRCTSLCRIEIPSPVEVIGLLSFCECISLNDLIFSSPSQLRVIHGLERCTSLCRIEIPSLVAVIGDYAFYECAVPNEVIFSSDTDLREIHGFWKCRSLYRIEIPSSVEVIGESGFFFCTSLRIIALHAGCRMRENQRLQTLSPFLVYEDDDIKESRRLIHLGSKRRKASFTRPFAMDFPPPI